MPVRDSFKMLITAAYLSVGCAGSVVVACRLQDSVSITFAISWLFIVGTVLGLFHNEWLADSVRTASQTLLALSVRYPCRVSWLKIEPLISNWADDGVRRVLFVRVDDRVARERLGAWGAYTDPFGISVVIATDDGSDEIKGTREYFALHELGHISASGTMHSHWVKSRLLIIILGVAPIALISDGLLQPTICTICLMVASIFLPVGASEAAADNSAIGCILMRHGLPYTQSMVEALERITRREVNHADKRSSPGADRKLADVALMTFAERYGQMVNLQVISRYLKEGKLTDLNRFDAMASPLHLFLSVHIVVSVVMGIWMFNTSLGPSRLVAVLSGVSVPILYHFAKWRFRRLTKAREELVQITDKLCSTNLSQLIV